MNGEAKLLQYCSMCRIKRHVDQFPEGRKTCYECKERRKKLNDDKRVIIEAYNKVVEDQKKIRSKVKEESDEQEKESKKNGENSLVWYIVGGLASLILFNSMRMPRYG